MSLTPITAVRSLAAMNLLMQSASSIGATAGFDAAGRLTLDASLVVAVGVLWKALNKKDDQLMEMTKQVTQVMTNVLAAVTELRLAVKELSDKD